MENEVIYCEFCSNEIQEDEEYFLVDGYICCSNCCENDCFHCDGCDELYHRSQLQYFSGVGDLCETCAEDVYRCENCGNYMWGDNVYWLRDIPYCYDCYCEVKENSIYEYNYKPSPIFHGDGFATFGVELEVDNGNFDVIPYLLELSNNETLFYLKRDGSLNEGFEIVTHPCSLYYHLNYFPWYNILSLLREYNFVSHDSGTCGLHIHVSRKFFGRDVDRQDLNIAKLILFVEKNFEKIRKFSRRTWSQIEKWAQRYNISRLSDAEKITKDCDLGRYYAVNLSNRYTIELRIFRGTLLERTFFATLQFTWLLCLYAKTKVNINSLEKTLNWQNFINFCKVYNFRYLNEYLKVRGLI